MARKTFTQSMVVLAFLGFVACEAPPSNKGRTAVEAESKQPASSCNLETILKPGVPGSPNNLIESDINPNGDSELAHLMRKMLKDLQDIRPLVLARIGANRSTV